MTSVRWKYVQELLERALAINVSDRSSWLEDVCGDDVLLRNEVESLLAAYTPAQDFLEAPLPTSIIRELEQAFNGLEGQRIGAYRIVREIGHGGMGTVYLATRSDDQYQKRVAIKVISRGMDTESVVHRFRRERQILAALDHPHIARLFDGGTTNEGRPYLVMEYIEGQALDSYCDARRLSIPQRLNLFRTVCSAVQYAHRNLIVHQDIKPTNILVTAEGAPKLLDFGIAKLLNPELGGLTLDRTAEARLITPEYASPEQIRGDPVTTAADVYALGVLLYRLLTGRHPYVIRSRAAQDWFRVVCDTQPEAPSVMVARPLDRSAAVMQEGTTPEERPSEWHLSQSATLSRQLRGDLDNIILKALRKEPERRYSSPEQFSEDIRRFLERLPVSARRATFTYRMQRFVRRQWIAVVAGVIVSVLLASSVGAVAWQARIARVERARADRRFNDVRKLANSYLFEFHDAIENLPGSTPARSLLVTRALEYLNDLSKETGGDPDLERELATAYQRIGNVQGQPAFANLGDSVGALKSYANSLAIREKLVQNDPGSVRDRLALGEIYRLKGNLLAATGRRSAAFDSVRKAFQIDRELLGGNPGNREIAIQLAMAHSALASLEAGVNSTSPGGDLNAAVQNQEEALRIYESQLTLEPSNRDLENKAAFASMRLGDVLAKLGRTDASLASYRQSLGHFEPLAADGVNARLRRIVAGVWYRIGTVQIGKRQFQNAEAAFQKGFSLSQTLASADPENVQAQADLAYGYADLGEARAREGKLTEGLAQLRHGIRMMEQILASNPRNAWVRSSLMQTYVTAGDLVGRSDAGKRQEFFAKAEESARLTLVDDPADADALAVLDHCSPKIKSR